LHYQFWVDELDGGGEKLVIMHVARGPGAAGDRLATSGSQQAEPPRGDWLPGIEPSPIEAESANSGLHHHNVIIPESKEGAMRVHVPGLP
jgi:hypothetical protein